LKEEVKLLSDPEAILFYQADMNKDGNLDKVEWGIAALNLFPEAT
jgi:hypothetical protein